jgi:predicted GIY-YIG superfamily endonuclease
MARTGLIYKLTSPSGKVYVGQTVNLKERVKQYRVYENYKGRKQPKLFH